MNNPKRLFLAVIAVAVLFGAGGYVLGQQLESPEDARDVAAAPEPSLIAVPIESVALSNDVVVRGDAEFEGAVDLVLAASSSTSTDVRDSVTQVVTGRVPEVDSLVDEGDVAIEVSGRPVFILEGDLPAFREFKPGIEGDDVLQLEISLQRLGYLTVEPDTLYGAATEDAIAAMFEAAGYDAPAASTGEETQLDNARNAVKGARESLADANDRLSQALKPESLAVQEQTRQQRRDLTDALDAAEDALKDTREGLPSIDLIAAIEERQRLNNIVPPEGIYQTFEDLAVASTAADRRIGQFQDLDNESLDRAEKAVEDAKKAIIDFDAIEQARDADGTDTSSLSRQVTSASDALADQEADLADLEEDIGVRLPVAEVVFLPDLPRTVTSVEVERGDAVTASVMRISGTEIRISSGVSEANRPLLELGQTVIIDNEALNIELEGEITELADRKGTNDVADTRYFMEVTPRGEYSVTELVDVNFRLKIPLEKSEGEVLAVPLAALSAGADGSSRVELLTADESSELVLVEPGLSDKNRSLVEIRSLGRDLNAGDLVVIGIEQDFSATTAEADGADEAEEEGGS